jgi:PAS domain S-box-containing protein
LSFESLAPSSAQLGVQLGSWGAVLRFSCWSIKTRISVLMLALVLPVNLVIFGVIWHLAESAKEMQRTSLLYTARTVAAAVDAKLGEYVTLTQALARSPALLEASLDAFEAEARRAFLSTEDGWMIVADLEGQQLLNTAVLGHGHLPIRNSVSLEAQRQALGTGSAAVSKVQFGRVSQSWIIDITVPVFKNGKLFRALSVSLKAQAFLRLLGDQHIPRNWLASIIDGAGRIIAGVPAAENIVGQLTSQSWRNVMHGDGVFDLTSADGDPIISAQVHPAASGWLVGIAVKKAEMDSAVWSTIRWAELCGGGLSVLSLLLGSALSSRITRPIAELRQNATGLLTGNVNVIPAGPPEVRDLWSALTQSTAQRRQAECLLAEREERFRGIYEHAGTGIAITGMQGRFQSCNPAYIAMLDYSEEELRQLDSPALIHPEDRRTNLEKIGPLVSQEIPSFEITNRFVAKNGRPIWVHKHVSLLRDAHGRPTNLIELVTDISERKQYEERLRQSEEHLQFALGAAQLGTWRWDILKGANVLQCDMRCRALFGLSPDAPITNTILASTILPEDRAGAKAAAARALDPADPHDGYACEYRVKHPDGTVLWLSSAGRAFFEPDPNSASCRRAVLMAGALRDVTEAHLAKASREGEERLRHLGDSLPECAVYRYAHEADGTPRFHYISAGIEQLNGVRAEDALHDAGVLLGQILPDYRPLLDEAEMCSARDMTDFKLEVPMRRPDGSLRWMRFQSRPDFGQNGTVIWDGVQTDVTEQRHAAEALRESEAQLASEAFALRRLNEASSRLWRAKSLREGLDEMLSAAIELLGADKGDIKLLDASQRVLTIAAQRGFDQPFLDFFSQVSGDDDSASGRALRSGERIIIEDVEAEENYAPFRSVAVAAGYRAVQCTPLIGRDGTPLGMIATHFRNVHRPTARELHRLDLYARQAADFIERCKSDEILSEREERFRGIFENAGTGIAITDKEGRFQCCNPAYASLLGYSEQELRGLSCTALIHPDDRERNLAEKRRLNAGEISSFKLVNRYVAKDGTSLWVHKHVSLLRDAVGNPTNTIALVTDIGERKRQEDHIRLLMREVNHRSKNLLTVVQSIARQTASAGPADFLERFEHRIAALAASQDLLVKNEWKGVDLEELVRSQLAHFEDLIGRRITLQGPPLFISASAAQAIGMALHELATNAGKYGALAGGSGRAVIAWRIKRTGAAEVTFQMDWRELCAHAVPEPSKRGFGLTMICQIVEMKLDAEVDLGFPSTGLTWRLQCPAGQVLEGSRPPSVETKAKPMPRKLGSSTRPRILVVEDEAIVALEIGSVLANGGFEVVGPARSVSQALDLINERGCDAAVLDINLGRETSEAIAHKLKGLGTGFVSLSGYSPEQHPAVFKGAAALTKPLQAQLLISELTKCLTANSWSGLS